MGRRGGGAGGTPAKPRKRGRQARRKEGEESEDDELVAQQMKRKMILEGKDDDEELGVDFREEGGHMLEDIYIPPKILRAEHPCTGERLVIEKIVCENFKSYGGLKEMGPFHKSFSAIIGPNGNGKSNIIDAMLFVFGYRATKIRCKKVSTLIHKSELLPDLRSCAVTVHFVKIIDEGDKVQTEDYAIVPNSRITVNRRAFHDNSSRYNLDGKNVKFQDVAKFLKANGIDIVHNRFLILQGEVEQIAQMPPISPNGHDTGLLEFLEEVIGTKRYIKPLAQLDERVEKYDYERDEKLQRVDCAEKEKAALTEPVRKAKEYLREQNSKTKYQSLLLQKQAHIAKLKVEEKQNVKVEIEGKLEELQKRLEEISGMNKARLEEFHAAEKEFKTCEREYNKAKKALDAADAQYIQLNEELQRTNDSRKKLMKDVAQFEKDLEKLTGLPEKNEKEIDELKKQKLKLDGEVEKEEQAVKGDLEKLNLKVEAALKEKEKSDQEFAALKKIRDAKKSVLDKLQKELTIYKEREVVEKKKLEDLGDELEKLKEAIVTKQRESRSSLGNNRLEAMETSLQQSQGEVTRLAEVEAEKKGMYEQTRGEYLQAQDSLEGNKQLDQVDRALMEAKQDGMFPGLYGRMKDLAKIEEKYNVAATTASSMLDYWVTDDDNTAGACIQFLRENSLPSQTFVCLTKLGSLASACQQRFDTPAQSQRIFDLLTIQKRELAPAYYKAFRNTLVANTIDIATKVSYGGRTRHRVVTLQGQIVETTGSLVGGGRSPTVGKFNSKKSTVTVTKQQLANLQQIHDAALKGYQHAQDLKQKAEEKVRNLTLQIQEFKSRINNFTSDLSALQAQLPLKQANYENQKRKVTECATVPKVLKEKEAGVEKADSEYQESIEPCQEAEENATNLSQKVTELQVNKKKEITKKLDKFVEMRKKVDSEMNKKIVELKNCETNRKKIDNKLESTRKEIEKLQNSMGKMDEKKKEVFSKAAEIREQEKEFAEKAEAAKKTYDDLKGNAHEFQQEENKLTKEKLSLEHKYSDATNAVKGCKGLLTKLHDQIANLKVHDIPEETVEPLKELTEEELEEISGADIERKLEKYTQKLKSKQPPNLVILDDYRNKINQLFQRIKELEEITKMRDMFREAFCKLDQQRSTEFMEGFALISSRLKEMFRMISMGGDAELEVVDILDLFGCGIQFSVRPARKTWKKISNLSGGEKTLASLSLVFALHHFKPSPFYVMDEIDAALDFKNVSIIANYIKDRTKFTQFIIISLRSNMFELADSLLGVYKIDNMSYSIHIGVKRLVTELKNKYELAKTQHQLASQPTQNARKISVGKEEPLSQPAKVSLTKAKPGFPNNVSAIHSEGEGDEMDDHVRNVFSESLHTDENAEVIEESQEEEPDDDNSHQNTVMNGNNELESSNKSEVNGRRSSLEIATGAGSEDMFEDMEVEPDSFAGPGPLAASTPFVGKRTTVFVGSPTRRSNGRHEEVTPYPPPRPIAASTPFAKPRRASLNRVEESQESSIEDVDVVPESDNEVESSSNSQSISGVSPIKSLNGSRVLASDSEGDSEVSYKTAEDSENSQDFPDEIGPTQE